MPNTNSSVAVRRRASRVAEHLKKRVATFWRAIRRIVNPAAALSHLSSRQVLDYMCGGDHPRDYKKLVFDLNALDYCFNTDKNVFFDDRDPSQAWVPDPEIRLRPIYRKNKVLPPGAENLKGLMQLPSGFYLHPSSLSEFCSQGIIRSAYYWSLNPDQPRPYGEWPLVYTKEMSQIFPCGWPRDQRRRGDFWLHITREGGRVCQIAIYSKGFRLRSILHIPDPPNTEYLSQSEAQWWGLTNKNQPERNTH